MLAPVLDHAYPNQEIPLSRRDPRPMNSMTPETRYAHGFLLRWGEWSRDIGVRAWPEKTLLKRMMEAGPEGALIQGGHVPIADPSGEVLAVESIVKRMGAIDQLVLRVEYVEPWAMRDTKARVAHMKPSKFERTLRRARERVYFGLIASDEFARASKAE